MVAKRNQSKSGFRNRDEWQPEPQERRGYAVLGLTALAMAGLGVITLRQLGAIKRLPDPPSSLFDSNKVVMSRQARKLLGIPDGVLGLASYGATLGCVWWNYRFPSRRGSLALSSKVALDVSQALIRSLRQWPEFGCLCSWCLIPVACSMLTASLVAPEAITVLQSVARDDVHYPQTPSLEGDSRAVPCGEPFTQTKAATVHPT